MVVSAWDAQNKFHIYNIDTGKHFKKISPDTNNPDRIITAITPALDTVWVGMASGHIMVFHEDELLAWFHPDEDYIRFLICIPCAGPYEMEKAMVVSGGKGFMPLDEGLEKEQIHPDSDSLGGSSMIVWEAYEAKTIRQVKIVEKSSPNHLKDHSSIIRGNSLR